MQLLFLALILVSTSYYLMYLVFFMILMLPFLGFVTPRLLSHRGIPLGVRMVTPRWRMCTA